MADRRPLQRGRRLEIHTVLDGTEADPDTDPLLLVWAKGIEEISQPFIYNVKMWRLVDDHTRQPLPPGDMINTPAEVRINIKQTLELGETSQSQDDPLEDVVKEISSHVSRFGVFETFNDEGTVVGETSTVLGRTYRIRQYSGTIVPAFKMMTYENTYRVFEDRNAIQIIHAVTEGFPYFKLNDDKLNNTFFPKIPYCVQFGESTYNFLSRLMARFGIWYYFDHILDANNSHSTMVLGSGPTTFDKCQTSGPSFLADRPIYQLAEITNRQLEPSAQTIKNFQRLYNPVPRRARFGNFNILNPMDPITGATDLQAQRDLIVPIQTVNHTKGAGRTEPDDDDRYRTEGFGAPIDQNDDPTSTAGPSGPNAKAYSRDWMRSRESLVAKVSGSTRNAAFVAGFAFERISSLFRSAKDGNDLIGQEDQETADAGADSLAFQNRALKAPPVLVLGSYVLLRVEFEGLETSYSEDSQNFGKILSELLFPSNLSGTDMLANATAQGVNNYLQNQLPLNFGQPPSGPMPYFGAFVLGGGVAAITAVIPLIVQAIEKFRDEKTSDFHCSFVAIPTDGIDYSGDGHPKTNAPLLSLPMPSGWVKATAGGPHLGLVIGENGINDDTDRGQVYADTLGRVRVRFPWDRKKGEQPGGSFKRGDNACWVRVSDGWAGRRFGIQFLPRVGQEVIVDFIDGDPDRPIITGRVYNADHHFANLPFPHGHVQQQPVELKDVLNPKKFMDFRYNGIKTSSLPKPRADSPERFHLLRFDDTYHHEQYLMRAQNRLDITAFGQRYESIGSNRHLTVGGKKTHPPPKEIGGDYITKIFRHAYLHVGDPEFPTQSGNRSTKLEQSDYIHIVKDSGQQVDGNWSVTTGGQATIDANGMESGGTIVLNALVNITLKCGPSTIVMTPSTIAITSPMVLINSAGPAPIPPIDANEIPLVEPSAADPGDSLDPPK